MTITKKERAAFQRSERRRRLLEAAMAEAGERGFSNMTRKGVSGRAGLAHGSINHEFGNMDAFRSDVLQEAIDTRNLRVLAQGLAVGHPVAKGAPPGLRDEAARELA